MKTKKLLIIALLTIGVFACRDEALNPVIPFETAVHGYGHLVGGNTFTGGGTDPNTGLFISGTVAYNSNWDFNTDFQWISIDKRNTVIKIEIYATFTEPYRDSSNNNQTANHGTVLIKTFEGASVPANRTSFSINVTPSELRTAFSAATFDYQDGLGAVNVLNNTNTVPGKDVARNPASLATQFISKDNFRLTWILYTEDGRIFDSWSDSICSEFPGADCFVDISVI